MTQKSNVITLYDKNGNFLISLNIDEIEECILHQEYEFKEKSFLYRTIAGGVLAGPTGAVLGAISSFIPKAENKYYLEIIQKNSKQTENIIIPADLKTCKKIQRFIAENSI